MEIIEFACTERFSNSNNSNLAERDPVIFNDRRVIENLLKEEASYVPKCNYFVSVQNDIQPFMRKVVTTWMLEVCEEQMCEETILPLAVNYMDRFLCVCPIKRQQLQLLGATCLLIASKFRSTNYLPIDLLCAYTDYSTTHDLISSWEMLVLSKLDWNVSAITSYDFINQIIERFSWGNESHFIRRHAQTLVSICCTDPNLIETPASVIATACISSAMRGLQLSSATKATFDMCSMIGIDPVNLEILIRFIDSLVESGVSDEQTKLERKSVVTSETKYSNESSLDSYSQPETPTEVDNVYF